MVLVEGLIVGKMGVTPTSIALMFAYNAAWAAGAILVGDALFGTNEDLTYVGEGLYRDNAGNLYRHG